MTTDLPSAGRHVWGLFPHTHVRGKRWSYMLELPDGTKTAAAVGAEVRLQLADLLHVQGADAVPKGARIVSTAWYDNSAANRPIPIPTIDVKWGDQTWEEMQYTGILYSTRLVAATASR